MTRQQTRLRRTQTRQNKEIETRIREETTEKTRAHTRENTRMRAQHCSRRTQTEHRTEKKWTGLDWTGRAETETETRMFYARVHGRADGSRLTGPYTGDGHAQQNSLI